MKIKYKITHTIEPERGNAPEIFNFFDFDFEAEYKQEMVDTGLVHAYADITNMSVHNMFMNLIKLLGRWFDIEIYAHDDLFVKIWFTHTNGFDYILTYKAERLN